MRIPWAIGAWAGILAAMGALAALTAQEVSYAGVRAALAGAGAGIATLVLVGVGDSAPEDSSEP